MAELTCLWQCGPCCPLWEMGPCTGCVHCHFDPLILFCSVEVRREGYNQCDGAVLSRRDFSCALLKSVHDQLSINIFKCMSSQGLFLSTRSQEFPCALLWCPVWCLVASAKVWLCQGSLFLSVQEKMLNGNAQLLWYYLAVIGSWAQVQICCQRGLSGPVKIHFWCFSWRCTAISYL